MVLESAWCRIGPGAAGLPPCLSYESLVTPDTVIVLLAGGFECDLHLAKLGSADDSGNTLTGDALDSLIRFKGCSRRRDTPPSQSRY